MLELKNINKTFGYGTVNETKVFENFNLIVPQGQFISIVGSNGSGKTTLLNIISGNIKVDDGKITLFGNDITNSKEYIRCREISRVYQNPSMGIAGNMTIAENLSIADNKGKRYGLSVGLNKKKIDYYKDILSELGLGLEDKMNVLAGSLSGGQRQALGLIMSTMSNVKVLLLDEHTAALDPKTSEQIMKITNEVIKKKKLTSLMVTHNLRYAVEYGDRLIMMDKGKAVIDVSGKEKLQTDVQSLLEVFNKISIECGN